MVFAKHMLQTVAMEKEKHTKVTSGNTQKINKQWIKYN